ncbi:MAG: ComEC/Rec2 family competence protein [Rhodospirillales bacterium]|nr:ComEC/Rec2 family competence protein [Rhodospirillales bacterium]
MQQGGQRRPIRWSEALFEEERERWLLWLPVSFGCGIALFFLLDRQPPWWPGPLSLALAAAGLWLCRPSLTAVYLLLLFAAAGFGSAQLRTTSVAAPLVSERFGPVEVTGRLLALDRRPRDTRLLLSPESISGLVQRDLPQKLRLRLAGKRPVEAQPGDQVVLRAVLLPPPPPVFPGGYDFGRQAYYRGIGGSGFVLGAPQQVQAAETDGWHLFWARLRDNLGLTLRAALPADQAGIAEALLTGQRAGIEPALQEDYRRSGLAHLLAISGLHVGLIATIFFFSLRALLALSPSLALNWPIKKIAALVTAVLLPFYLPMVGASVPTQRACLMTLVVLAAVLLNRRAISMRLVAVAALAVLALTPESLLTASFQLSFAAVTALVAAYEVWQLRRPDWKRGAGLRSRLLLYFLGVLASSMIATLATAPFAAYHFHRLALYGLAANLLAVPLTAFWIMPFCLLSYLLLPLGLEQFALTPLGWGLEALNTTAQGFSALPGATLNLPAMPLWGLVLLGLGLLWLSLWRSRWRLAGLSFLLLGAISPALNHPPNILVSGDQRLLGLTAPDGSLWLSSGRVGRFAADVWLRRHAQAEPSYWPPNGDGHWLRCDSLGCRYQHDGQTVALALAPEALQEDCHGVALLIATSPVPKGCLPGGRVLDRFDFWHDGTHAVWLSNDRVEVLSVGASRGNWPWNPPRRSGQKIYVP